MTPAELDAVLDFLRRSERLKIVTRTAWTSAGTRETTAAHSWRLGLFALSLRPWFPALNFDRVLALTLVHDLGEAVGGDISAVAQAGAPPKSAQERRDLCELLGALPAPARESILTLWDEYEANTTPEARFVKAVDKLETILQHNQGRNPPDFDYAFNLAYGAELAVHDPLLRQLRAAIDAETKNRMPPAAD